MALKLDPAEILVQLNKELAEGGGEAPDIFKAPAGGALDTAMFHVSTASRRGYLPAIVAAVVVAVGAVTGMLVYHHNAKKDPLEGLSAGLYQAPAGDGKTLPLPEHRN